MVALRVGLFTFMILWFAVGLVTGCLGGCCEWFGVYEFAVV